MSLVLNNITGYTKDGIGVWLGNIPVRHDVNIKTIDKINPLADYVFDFEKIDWQTKLDFIVMQSYVRKASNPIRVIGKALKIIKEGGYFIIADNAGPDMECKNYFNFAEMEGMLNLFEDFVFIEGRGLTADGKEYYYICKKKREVEYVETLEGKSCEEVKENADEKGTESTDRKE
jgi:SAM-dependent methyltransferase